MKNSLNWTLLTMLFLLQVMVMSSCENECVQGQIRECTCPATKTQGQQICLNFKGEWGECTGCPPAAEDTESETLVDSEKIDAGDTDDAGTSTETAVDTGDSEKATDTVTETDKGEDTNTDTTSDQETDTGEKPDAGNDAGS